MIKKTILTTFAMLTLGANIISAQVKLQSNNIDDVLSPAWSYNSKNPLTIAPLQRIEPFGDSFIDRIKAQLLNRKINCKGAIANS